MNILKLIALLAFFIIGISEPVKADTVKVVYYGISHHFNGNSVDLRGAGLSDFNETHKTSGLEYWSDDNVYSVGRYKDSYARMLHYIAYTRIFAKNQYYAFGGSAGITSGETQKIHTGTKYTATFLPYLELKYNDYLQVNITYIPKVSKETIHTIGIQFKIDTSTLF